MTDRVGYLDIADHYRRQINDRQISDGERLPSVRQLADEWDVSTKTAHRALSALRMEGYARPETGLGYAAASPGAVLRIPIDGNRQRGEVWGADAAQQILFADTAPATGTVADVLGVDPGTLAVVRRGVVKRGEQILRMAYSWYPSEYAELVPELLVTESTPPGTVARIEAATGRRTAVTTDQLTVDTSSKELAEHFGFPQGEVILGRTTIRHDGISVIEYGITWWPRYVKISMEYRGTPDPVYGPSGGLEP